MALPSVQAPDGRNLFLIPTLLEKSVHGVWLTKPAGFMHALFFSLFLPLHLFFFAFFVGRVRGCVCFCVFFYSVIVKGVFFTFCGVVIITCNMSFGLLRSRDVRGGGVCVVFLVTQMVMG